MCHVSCVMCQVTCHLSQIPTATATDPPQLSTDMPFDQRSLVQWKASFLACDIHTYMLQTYIQTDIVTTRLIWTEAPFSEDLTLFETTQHFKFKGLWR